MKQKRTRIGVLGMEFHRNSRDAGGFGKIARTIGSHFQAHPHLGIDVTFLDSQRHAPPDQCAIDLEGTRMILRPAASGSRLRRWWAHHSLLRRERLDAFLAIDFEPRFEVFFSALPRTPIIVWSRDPWPPEDREKILTLKLPGANDVVPGGVVQDRHSSLRSVIRKSRLLRRPVLLAATDPFVAAKVPATYDLRAQRVAIMPNFLDFEVGKVRKSDVPRLVFLGRLDPIKRPWLFFAMAEALPEVEFVCLGEPTMEEGIWRPNNVPPNVRMLGHQDGKVKVEQLESSWLLVNTSIHEGLAVSFLEALACETPVVSTVSAGGLADRFGRFVGRWDADGMDALPHLVQATKELLGNHAERMRIGRDGRQWVEETHNFPRFFSALLGLLREAGVSLPPPAVRAGVTVAQPQTMEGHVR